MSGLHCLCLPPPLARLELRPRTISSPCRRVPCLDRLRHPRLRGGSGRGGVNTCGRGASPAPQRRASAPRSSTRSWRATSTRPPTRSSRSPRATSRPSRRSSYTCIWRPGHSGTPGRPPEPRPSVVRPRRRPQRQPAKPL